MLAKVLGSIIYFYRNLFKVCLLLKKMSDPAAERFDCMYENGETPTLKDKVALFNSRIHVHERAQRELSEWIKSCLFELNKRYTPSNEARAHGLIYCTAPVLDMNEELIASWMEQYEQIMKTKHKGKSVFHRNYDYN